jgi:hypothetical protein
MAPKSNVIPLDLGIQKRELIQTPEAITRRKWAAKNRDKLRVYEKSRKAQAIIDTKQWVDDNPEKYTAYQKTYNERRYTNRFYWARYKIYHIRRSAKYYALDFNLTAEYLLSIFPEDGICPVLGIPFYFGKGKVQPNTPSIDRIIPKKGYVIGNVNIISCKANVIKQNSIDPNEFRSVADYLERCLVSIAKDSQDG